MEAGTEDLSKYAEAAAKRDALEEKLKALQAEYEAAKKDVENIEQERAAALRKRERAEADGVIETVEERYARLLWYLEPAYAVADFAWLFLGVVPSAASCVASAFRQAWRKLVAKLSEIIRGATDIVGGKVETRPVDNTSLYPIEGSSSKALSNFAPRELLSITQAKFLCKRLFRVLLKSFLRLIALRVEG